MNVICNVCEKEEEVLNLDYYRCDNCGLITMLLAANENIYDHKYAHRYRELQDTHNGRLMNLFRARLLSYFLTEFPIPNLTAIKVFDIGCGCGDFMDAVRSEGYEVYGCELNSQYEEVTAEHVRPYIHRCKFEDYQIKQEDNYTAVTAFDVLEHTENPRAVLQKINNLLNLYGKLVLSIPDVNGWNMDWPLANYRHYKPGEHLFLFGANSLEVLLVQCGFKILHTCWFEDGFRRGKELEKNIKTVVAEKIRNWED